MGLTLSGIGVLASLVITYVLAALSPADRSILRRTENGLLAGGVAVVCYGLFQLTVLGGFPNGKSLGLPAAVSSGRFGNDLLGPDIESISLLLPRIIALSRAFTRVRNWPPARVRRGGGVHAAWDPDDRIADRDAGGRCRGAAAGVAVLGTDRHLEGRRGRVTKYFYQAHNLWLLIGVELGTPGLLLFTAGLGAAAAEALRIPRELRGPPMSALVGLCVGVFFLSSMEFKFFCMVLIVIA